MSAPRLRPYQLEAKAAVKRDFQAGCRRVGVSLPTGCGKTVVFADMVKDAYLKGSRTVVLVHRDVLIDQAVEKLSKVIPRDKIGVVKASKNEVTASVVVASIHTLRSDERLRQIIPPDLTVVDEAHVSVSDGYRKYYQHVGAMPGTPEYSDKSFLAGFTATWMRNDTNGLGDIWEKVSYRRSIKWAVDNGFLVRPRAVQLGGQLDLSEVRTAPDGDYNERDLGKIVTVDSLLETVVAGYKKFAAGRPAVLFAPTQASARYFLEGLTAAGVPTAEIFAGTSPASRRWAFSAFDNGATHVLGTCTALSVGWDCPRCSVALMVRPTRSLLMFIQQIGRILRPWPGKSEGLILDFVGATDNKDMRSIVDLRRTPEEREADGDLEDDEIEDDYARVPISPTAKRITGVTEIDLFAGTNARWLYTDKGVPFVQTAQHTYWVSMLDGAWAVGRCGARSRRDSIWLRTGLDSGEALEEGSDIALAEDPSIADKRSSWRKKGDPSAEQIAYALTLGVYQEGMSKSDLSDAISIKIASGLLAGVGGA